MYVNKARLVAMAIIMLVVTMLLVSKNMARYSSNSEKTGWKVAITSDGQNINDTQEINFKVENNQNVKEDKIAPGLKATSTVEIDLEGTRVPVDIVARVDSSKLYEQFDVTARLDGEEYDIGTTKTVELQDGKRFTRNNGKKILTLELKWKDDYNYNKNDTQIGIAGDQIQIPIEVNVTQHI